MTRSPADDMVGLHVSRSSPPGCLRRRVNNSFRNRTLVRIIEKKKSKTELESCTEYEDCLSQDEEGSLGESGDNCRGEVAMLDTLKPETESGMEDPTEDYKKEMTVRYILMLENDIWEDCRGDNTLCKTPRLVDNSTSPREQCTEIKTPKVHGNVSGVDTTNPDAKSNEADGIPTTPKPKFKHSRFVDKTSSYARVYRYVNQARIVVGLALAFFWFASLSKGILEWYFEPNPPEEVTTMTVVRLFKTQFDSILLHGKHDTLTQRFFRQMIRRFRRSCRSYYPRQIKENSGTFLL